MTTVNQPLSGDWQESPVDAADYDKARDALHNLREAGAAGCTVEVYGDYLTEFLNVLGDMLTGDPWQEGSYAVQLLSILDETF